MNGVWALGNWTLARVLYISGVGLLELASVELKTGFCVV